MARYTFDGTASQTIAFNALVDRVTFTVDAAGVANIVEDRDNNTVTFIATTGAVLTLTGTSFDAINDNANSIIAGPDSDIVFAFGTNDDDDNDDNAALAGNVVTGLEGDDTLTATTDDALLLGNQDDDILISTVDNARLYGGMGDDFLRAGGNGGPDNGALADFDTQLLVGGLGTDRIDVGPGNGGTGFTGDATIYGGNFANDPSDLADTINVGLGAGGSALVFGNGGGDTINIFDAPRDASATVFGGVGNDTVTATVADGLFVGGAGTDTITMTIGESATVYGGNGVNDSANDTDTISVTGGDGAVVSIYGNGGNDVITVGRAADVGTPDANNDGAQFNVFGGSGNDAITGTVGDGSVVYGGLGGDGIRLSLSGNDAAVTIYGGNGNSDAADNADNITVTLTSTAATTTNGVPFPAADQSAVIFGNAGEDNITLNGAGEATVFGGAGDDTIVLNDSNGATAGGLATGQYVLTGGAGEDTFDVSGFDFEPRSVPATSSATAATTADVEDDVPFITDFAFGTDTIVLPGNTAVGFVSDQTGASFTQTTLSAAAEAAFDAAVAGAPAGAPVADDAEVAVLFTYQGDSYVAFGQNDNPEDTASGGEVDGYIKVTGYSGTISMDSFAADDMDMTAKLVSGS